MKKKQILALIAMLALNNAVYPGESSSNFDGQDGADQWTAPPPADDNSRILKFSIQAAFQQDNDLPGQAFSMIDLSMNRPLDENAVLAEGLIRFRKTLSTSDAANSLDLRMARLSYLEPWFQATVGRFDLFQFISPNLFFGAYPIMGLHRVDGVLATIPFSFFFNFGPSKEGKNPASSPLALSFFYSPSLFSAEKVQYDLTQSFWLSQLRFRIEGGEIASTFRANFAGSAADYFDYSSFNGGYSCSGSIDLSFQEHYDLTAEYGIQNVNRPQDTGSISIGFQASRLGTWGDFSLDQLALESQIPISQNPLNPFTGGNGLTPSLALTPKNSWYGKIRTRFKLLFIEFHLTNNQDDFTLGRPQPGSIGTPFTGSLGPGNETNGPGTHIRSASYEQLSCLLRTGVEF